VRRWPEAPNVRYYRYGDYAKMVDKYGVVHINAGSPSDGYGSYSWCIYQETEVATKDEDEPVTCVRCASRKY
jgi:hypothetical protein